MNHEKVTNIGRLAGFSFKILLTISFGRPLSWMYMPWVVKGHPKLMLAGAL